MASLKGWHGDSYVDGKALNHVFNGSSWHVGP